MACGEYAGYTRHYRTGEKPCEECKAARRAYRKAHKQVRGVRGKPCDVEGCGKPHYAKGYCMKHHKRWEKYGDPLQCKFEVGGVVGYYGAHYRIKLVKGRAADHPCEDCGGEAAQWSYDHEDLDELEEYTDNSYMTGFLKYSLNPDYYQARCLPCHTAFDKDL